MPSSRTTLVLLLAIGVGSASVLALPSTRAAYHRWRRDAHRDSAMAAFASGSPDAGAETSRQMSQVAYHEQQLLRLGYGYEGRFTLPSLAGDSDALADMGADFDAINNDRSASFSFISKNGLVRIWDDDPTAGEQWEAFVSSYRKSEE